MRMSKTPASFPQAVPVRLATSWFPSPLRAQPYSLLVLQPRYFSSHIDGNVVLMMIPTTFWDLQSPSSQVTAAKAVLYQHLFSEFLSCAHT